MSKSKRKGYFSASFVLTNLDKDDIAYRLTLTNKETRTEVFAYDFPTQKGAVAFKNFLFENGVKEELAKHFWRIRVVHSEAFLKAMACC